MKKVLNISILTILAYLAGCSKSQYQAAEPSTNFYLDPGADFASVSKVVVLELQNDNPSYPELGERFTQSLTDGLIKKHLFGISTIYRKDPEWTNLNLDGVYSMSLKDMAGIRERIKTDAILFGSVTQYSSYPRLLVGLRMKLMDLRTGKLLWAIEDVWDTTDKSVETRIKKYFESQIRTGYQPMNWQIILNSPNAFQRFVIFEITTTLPESRMG